MALIKCKDCGNEVSTDAKSCPKCGANIVLPKPPQKPTSPLLKYTLGLIVVGSIITMAMNGSKQRDAEKADQDQLAAMAPDQRAAVLAQRAEQKKADGAKVAADAKAKADSEAVSHDIGLAEVTCQMMAEKRANDPSSIDWLRQDRKFAFTSKDHKKATSFQPMRAKNAMGGLILTSVKCDLIKNGTDWEISHFDELH